MLQHREDSRSFLFLIRGSGAGRGEVLAYVYGPTVSHHTGAPATTRTTHVHAPASPWVAGGKRKENLAVL